MAGINLEKEYLTADPSIPGLNVISVTATADEPGLDDAIFVYRTISDTNPMPGDIFQCVASYSQVQELPIDTPETVDGVLIPDYRVATAKFVTTDPSDFEEIWAIIQSDTALLINQARFAASEGTTENVNVDPS